MAEPPPTGLWENKEQCPNEPSTNQPPPQTTTKTVDEDSVLPNQTPANETKKEKSIELVPFLLLASHTDIVNPTQSIPTLITHRSQLVYVATKVLIEFFNNSDAILNFKHIAVHCGLSRVIKVF